MKSHGNIFVWNGIAITAVVVAYALAEPPSAGMSPAPAKTSAATTTSAPAAGPVAELNSRIAEAKRKFYDPSKHDQYIIRDHEAYVFLAEALDSPDPEVRALAIKTLLALDYPIRGTAFLKFLSEKYPVEVQMVAMIWVLDGRGTTIEELDKARGVVSSRVNALLDAAVCPPHFEEVLVLLGQRHLELIDRANQPLVLKRAFVCWSRSTTLKRQWSIRTSIWGVFDSTMVLDAIEWWYPIEPNAGLRRAMVAGFEYGWTDSKTLTVVKRIMALAQKDPDKETAALATKILPRLEPPQE